MAQAKTRGNAYAIVCRSLAVLFAARVAGQGVQLWAPHPFLPPFEAFQGSSLPYSLLLSSQLLILAAMAVVSWRMFSGSLVPSRRVGRGLAWAGGAYMAIALARIAIGLALPEAPAWFRTWIPASFHVVLAGFVLTVCGYHLR